MSNETADDLTPLKYQSGEDIRKGDSVLCHGERGIIEFVVQTKTGDPALDWYIEEFGRGGFLVEVDKLGALYMAEADEDLVFLSRQGQPNKSPFTT